MIKVQYRNIMTKVLVREILKITCEKRYFLLTDTASFTFSLSDVNSARVSNFNKLGGCLYASVIVKIKIVRETFYHSKVAHTHKYIIVYG